MSSFTQKLRKNNKRKAISPVIATIILIAVALIIALLVGVFAFGLFTSNAKSVSLQSGTLYASTGTFAFVMKDPSASGTSISGATVNGPGLTSTTCTANPTVLNAGGITSSSCTLTGVVTAGNAYDYVINLANGQSISGTVIAQ